MMKSLIDFDSWSIEQKGPHAYIQWQGTDACMDFNCICGESGHIDSDFLFHVQCVACKRMYEVECFVNLLEITSPESIKELEASDAFHFFGAEVKEE